MNWMRIALAAAIAVCLAACASPATPTPAAVVARAETSTFTAVPTVPATPTPTPTATNTSTHTPSPTSTSTPSPTPTPTNTATETASPSTTHTPTSTRTHTPVPIRVTVFPSMDDGFELVCGHPPFTVDFSSRVSGGQGELSHAWDFDTDGNIDSTDRDPTPFTYSVAGVYNAALTVDDEAGEKATEERRIVVIGEPKWLGWRYGVMAHVDLAHKQYADMQEVNRALSMISEAGIQAIRVDFSWIVMEPDRGRFDWRQYDAMVSAIQEHHLGILALVGGSPRWATSTPTDSQWATAHPKDMQEYARFVYVLVSRYHDSVRAWAFWNEPNVSIYWKPAPDPLRFAEMQRLGYLAAKYADPSGIVLFTGLANDGSQWMPQHTWYPPEEFLQAVYKEIGGQFFDAVGRHPYAHPTWEGFDVLRQFVRATRAVMTANGDASKPLWLDEIGYGLTGGLTEEGQANWLVQLLDHMLSSTDYDAVFWYNFRNKPVEEYGHEEGSDSYIFEHTLGLVREDFTPKPAYHAYQQFIREHATP